MSQWKGGSFSLGGARPFDLPQVTMDGESVYADRDGLGGNDVELLAVGAVFVESVDHFAADGSRPGAFELDDLLGFGGIHVQRPELASTITEQDYQVVGLASLDFLWINGNDSLHIQTYTAGNIKMHRNTDTI